MRITTLDMDPNVCIAPEETKWLANSNLVHRLVDLLHSPDADRQYHANTLWPHIRFPTSSLLGRLLCAVRVRMVHRRDSVSRHSDQRLCRLLCITERPRRIFPEVRCSAFACIHQPFSCSACLTHAPADAFMTMNMKIIQTKIAPNMRLSLSPSLSAISTRSLPSYASP